MSWTTCLKAHEEDKGYKKDHRFPPNAIIIRKGTEKTSAFF
jgi:hypothetical protein